MKCTHSLASMEFQNEKSAEQINTILFIKKCIFNLESWKSHPNTRYGYSIHPSVHFTRLMLLARVLERDCQNYGEKKQSYAYAFFICSCLQHRSQCTVVNKKRARTRLIFFSTVLTIAYENT